MAQLKPSANKKDHPKFNTHQALLRAVTPAKFNVLVHPASTTSWIGAKDGGKTDPVIKYIMFTMEVDPFANALATRKYSGNAAARLGGEISKKAITMKHRYNLPYEWKKGQKAYYRQNQSKRSNELNQAVEFGSFEDMNGLSGFSCSNAGYVSVVHIEEPVEYGDKRPAPTPEKWEDDVAVIEDSVGRTTRTYKNEIWDGRHEPFSVKWHFTMNPWDENHPHVQKTDQIYPMATFIKDILGDMADKVGDYDWIVENYFNLVKPFLEINSQFSEYDKRKDHLVTRNTKFANPFIGRIDKKELKYTVEKHSKLLGVETQEEINELIEDIWENDYKKLTKQTDKFNEIYEAYEKVIKKNDWSRKEFTFWDYVVEPSYHGGEEEWLFWYKDLKNMDVYKAHKACYEGLRDDDSMKLARGLGLQYEGDSELSNAYNTDNLVETDDTFKILQEEENRKIIKLAIAWDIDVDRRMFGTPVYFNAIVVEPKVGDADKTTYYLDKKITWGEPVIVPARGKGPEGIYNREYQLAMRDASIEMLDKYKSYLLHNIDTSLEAQTHLYFDDNQGSFMTAVVGDGLPFDEIDTAYKNGDYDQKNRQAMENAMFDTYTLQIDYRNKEAFEYVKNIKKDTNGKRIEKGKFEKLADSWNSGETGMFPFRYHINSPIISEYYSEIEIKYRRDKAKSDKLKLEDLKNKKEKIAQ